MSSILNKRKSLFLNVCSPIFLKAYMHIFITAAKIFPIIFPIIKREIYIAAKNALSEVSILRFWYFIVTYSFKLLLKLFQDIIWKFCDGGDNISAPLSKVPTLNMKRSEVIAYNRGEFAFINFASLSNSKNFFCIKQFQAEYIAI